MSKPSDSQYLESKILTASQPRLHLMLLEGAIRFGRLAKQSWADEVPSIESSQMLNRTMDIVEELSLSASAGKGDISEQLIEQYAFLYRELGATRINNDRQKLDECLELLEYHRQTWKTACEQLTSDSPTPVKTPVVAPLHSTLNTSDSFSLEA